MQSELVIAGVLCVVWIWVSYLLIAFNKYLMTDGDFPFAAALGLTALLQRVRDLPWDRLRTLPREQLLPLLREDYPFYAAFAGTTTIVLNMLDTVVGDTLDDTGNPMFANFLTSILGPAFVNNLPFATVQILQRIFLMCVSTFMWSWFMIGSYMALQSSDYIMEHFSYTGNQRFDDRGQLVQENALVTGLRQELENRVVRGELKPLKLRPNKRLGEKIKFANEWKGVVVKQAIYFGFFAAVAALTNPGMLTSLANAEKVAWSGGEKPLLSSVGNLAGGARKSLLCRKMSSFSESESLDSFETLAPPIDGFSEVDFCKAATDVSRALKHAIEAETSSDDTSRRELLETLQLHFSNNSTDCSAFASRQANLQGGKKRTLLQEGPVANSAANQNLKSKPEPSVNGEEVSGPHTGEEVSGPYTGTVSLLPSSLANFGKTWASLLLKPLVFMISFDVLESVLHKWMHEKAMWIHKKHHTQMGSHPMGGWVLDHIDLFLQLWIPSLAVPLALQLLSRGATDQSRLAMLAPNWLEMWTWFFLLEFDGVHTHSALEFWKGVIPSPLRHWLHHVLVTGNYGPGIGDHIFDTEI